MFQRLVCFALDLLQGGPGEQHDCAKVPRTLAPSRLFSACRRAIWPKHRAINTARLVVTNPIQKRGQLPVICEHGSMLNTK